MTNTTNAPISAAPVVRDENGYWYHPALPQLDEDGAGYKAWLDASGLVQSRACLDDEDIEHPAYKRYFDDYDADISDWHPEAPSGGGWFLLAIGDTDDGPMAWFARPKEGAPA